MDISNHQTTPAQQKPLSVFARIFCCVVLLVCSAALPLLTFYIGVEGFHPAIPILIFAVVMLLCITFMLTLCRKPLFLGCAIAGILLTALFGPWLASVFAALLCATVAGAALVADLKIKISLLCGIPFVAALYGITFALTGDPLLCASVLLPALTAFAFGICYKKEYSIIVSIGVATGTLLVSFLALFVAGALLGGMQPSAQGVTDLIKSYHEAITRLLVESLQQTAELPEFADQLKLMFGGEITTEVMTEFSASVATAVIGMLPGACIMLAWCFAFIANRGLTALMMRGVDKKDYPAFLITYAPSVPSAIFMILCYAALMISSFIPQGEIAVFVSLNLLMALLPMMTVCGVLSIISNIKHAPVKWPMLITYALAVIFLGVATVPMIAFFGSFAVITQSLARALERKFKDFKGGQ